jgi:flagellar protein FliO/FliZ
MDLIDIARYLGALLLVLSLVGLAGLGVRRFGIPGVASGAATRRLAIVETLMIGPRQRLYILRRDGVEHLVMAGPDGTTVIETGIPAPQTTTPVAAAPETQVLAAS